MDKVIRAEERVYWEKEAQLRFLEVEASRARGDPPYLLVADDLRLREASERLIGLQKTNDGPAAI